MYTRQPPKPPYWQIDLFVIGMGVLLFALIRATPMGWHQPIEIGWCIVQVSGMAFWSRLNAPAIAAWNDWRNRLAGDEAALTPVQRHYRRVMSGNQKEDI